MSESNEKLTGCAAAQCEPEAENDQCESVVDDTACNPPVIDEGEVIEGLRRELCRVQWDREVEFKRNHAKPEPMETNTDWLCFFDRANKERLRVRDCFLKTLFGDEIEFDRRKKYRVICGKRAFGHVYDYLNQMSHNPMPSTATAGRIELLGVIVSFDQSMPDGYMFPLAY